MGRGQELLDAAREGDRKTVEKIIAQITKRSGPFPSIRRGPGVNVQDDNGYTPLHHACLNGHKEIVQLLLSVDASPNITDKKGATPLHLAAFKGFTDVARILLAHNNPSVNIDDLTLNNETALLIAAHFGFDDFVALMISRGADVTIRNFNDESALDLAAQYGRLKTVKFLLRVRPLLVEQYRTTTNRESIYLSRTTTPLHRAAKHGHTDVVIALIEAGVDPNIRTDSGTPLHEAACFARADVVRELLRRGADLKARDVRGKTVYDLLTAYPEEATRKVREVIREFVSHKSSYDSEEDLPPFPVAHDYSPTAPVYNLSKGSDSFSHSTNKPAFVQELNKFQETDLTNAYNKSVTILPLNSTLQKYPSNESVDSELIARTDSFLTKQKFIKKLLTDADPRGNEIVQPKVHVIHFDVLSELQSLHQNITKGSKPSPKSKNIVKTNIFKSISSIWPGLDSENVSRSNRCDSVVRKNTHLPSDSEVSSTTNRLASVDIKTAPLHSDPEHASLPNRLNSVDRKKTLLPSDPDHALRPNRLDSVDRKKTPLPSPKPKIKQIGINQDEVDKSKSDCYHNSSQKQLQNVHQTATLTTHKIEECIYANTFSEEIYANLNDFEYDSEQIYENLPYKNVTDEVKEIIPNENPDNHYTDMDLSVKITITDYAENVSNNSENHYLRMHAPAKMTVPDFTPQVNNKIDNKISTMNHYLGRDLSVKKKATAYAANIVNQTDNLYLRMDPPAKTTAPDFLSNINNQPENHYLRMDAPAKMTIPDFSANVSHTSENQYIRRNPTINPSVPNLTRNTINKQDYYLKMDISANIPDFAANVHNTSDNHYTSKNLRVNALIKNVKNNQENPYLTMDPSIIMPVPDFVTKLSGKSENSYVGTDPSCMANIKPCKKPENIYLTMDVKPLLRTKSKNLTTGLFSARSSVKSLSVSADYINYDPALALRCRKRRVNSRIKSIPDCFFFGVGSKPYSMHIRGIPGCLFEDYVHNEYIYELNHKTIRGDNPPFIKKKVTESNVPCYCKDLSDYQIYYSCEKLNENESDYCYVEDLKNPNKTIKIKEVVENVAFKRLDCEPELDPPIDPSVGDCKLTGIVKKKVTQIKQLFIDWMAPETQKISNKNKSLLSPSSSSLTKSHPQSFVKKLASKCLGLKAKFNSAPNISNNAGTESEADVTSRSTNLKSNTNTLLIGNSKFFKILSKKEESGEVVCNDEFDTISLDRLGTLNRDSLVNRSNRSCPGFKTSLPNISENNELSDHESIAESVIITELDCDKSDNKINSINEAFNFNPNLNIFEPRERTSIISNASAGSAHLINECYESYEFHKTEDILQINSFPRPFPRPKATKNDDSMIYENMTNLRSKPTPAARKHIPLKLPLDEVEKKVLYENVSILKKPEPPKRTAIPSQSSCSDKDNSRSVSRSSTLSSDSMVDETNLEDILLSQKSKSFRHGQIPTYDSASYKSDVRRTQSNASDSSDVTEASAIENVDCSDVTDDKALYLSMTGTLPNKKTNTEKKKVLFRHKTFTNIEVDRNSVKVKDLPQWNNEFLKETLAHYHIRGTGHCIYNAPTVQEFLYIFNRDTLYKDVPPFTKVPNDKRDSYYETAICFCKPKRPKHHNSAEDLLEMAPLELEDRVSIDLEALKNRREIFTTSFKCFCDSGTCTFHSNRRESLNDLVVKFSAIKRSISTPDITLNPSFSTIPRTGIPKNYSVPHNLEEPYAVVSVDDIIQRNEHNKPNDNGDTYLTMSHPSTLSSSASRMYSIKDIAEVISFNQSSSTSSTLSNASDMHLPVRKSSSSEYSGHWSLQSCNSNVTIKSDASFKTCLEESSDENSDDTLHTDDESDTETIKSDISTVKRPWVHSDSFRFGTNTKPDIETIVEESQSSFEEKFESMSSKFESGISVEGSESSSSGGEDDSGVPRGGDMSLNASLERCSVSGGVRSGSGRRRWDEMEGMSEGDALSLSSAASSCAPLHLAHHHDYSKVSPTPPKKPPRRNLSVSPTHANSPSSGYSYELRVHARSQDDLDDIQGAKHYLKHGRSVDHYVDGKLSYSEYEENHNSPRVAPIPNPRPSLKQRSQPVAITAMYENVAVKEQNPRRKLRRNNFTDSYDPRMTGRKYSHQERSSLESLLDDQSMNSPSDCERYYDGPRVDIPLSPTHYEQPPTPEHPPPSARQAENSIHERIRPLSQLIMEVVEEIRIRKKSQGDITNS